MKNKYLFNRAWYVTIVSIPIILFVLLYPIIDYPVQTNTEFDPIVNGIVEPLAFKVATLMIIVASLLSCMIIALTFMYVQISQLNKDCNCDN